MCSLYRVVTSRSVCPTYAPLQVLHFILYIPAGFSFLVFHVSCCMMVFVDQEIDGKDIQVSQECYMEQTRLV